MRQNRISINDIKYDLIKIIDPWDGILENKPESNSESSEENIENSEKNSDKDLANNSSDENKIQKDSKSQLEII